MNKSLRKTINLANNPRTRKLPPDLNAMSILDYQKLEAAGLLAIPIQKGKNFGEALSLAKGNKNLMDELSNEYYAQGLDSLFKPGTNGTKVPFVATIQGKFAINPCSVNQQTLFRMIDTHDVFRRAYETNTSTLVGGVGEYKHLDSEIQKYGRRLFKKSTGGLERIMAQLWTASYSGYAVGRLQSYVDDDGYLMMKEMAHTPPQSVAFTLTPEGNVENYYQYVYGVPLGQVQNILSNGMYYDNSPNALNNIWGGDVNAFSDLGDLTYPLRSYLINQFGLFQLEKESTVHYIFDRINGKINPYGYPLNRSAFDQWVEITSKENMEMGAFARYANPLLVAYADGISTVSLGGGKSLPAIDALYYSMADWTNQSAIILSGKKGDTYSVDAIQTIADFKSFNESIKYNEGRIEKALLNPAGIYDSSTSYAGMTTQNSIYIRNMTTFRDELLREAVIDQIMAYYLRKNFGNDIDDFGYFETSLLSIEDQQKRMKVFETGCNQGIISSSYYAQNNIMLKEMGFPELSKEEFEELQLAKQKQADLNIKSTSNKDTTNKTEVKDEEDLYGKRSITEGL